MSLDNMEYGSWIFSEFLTCEEEKAKDHDRGVAKVEECWGAAHYVQLRRETK